MICEWVIPCEGIENINSKLCVIGVVSTVYCDRLPYTGGSKLAIRFSGAPKEEIVGTLRIVAPDGTVLSTDDIPIVLSAFGLMDVEMSFSATMTQVGLHRIEVVLQDSRTAGSFTVQRKTLH